jgi:hypothetical protein
MYGYPVHEDVACSKEADMEASRFVAKRRVVFLRSCRGGWMTSADLGSDFARLV